MQMSDLFYFFLIRQKSHTSNKFISYLREILSKLFRSDKPLNYFQMKKTILTSLITAALVYNNYAQIVIEPCYFDNYQRQNKVYVEKAEKNISNAIRNIVEYKNHSAVIKIIPVVVHVIHNSGTENISDSQIQSQITVLNEDFRKIAGTAGDGNGVDTEIEFCLAKKTPDGKCSNGIVRIQSSLTNHLTYQRAQLKNLSYWDNTRYLNMYIVKTINGTSGILGYSSYPGGPPDEDGIVVRHDYFGRNEYNNEKDYDGSWGIWDEEFLQYTSNTINNKPQPFFATVFTLTSHHPYPIPERYKNQFKDGALPIEKSIGYSDYALKKFFDSAKKMPWFYKTLFVLAADHTGVSADPFYTNKIGNYSIPIIYYMPNSQLKGLDSTITQQIDIMPSILDYLNYPSPYFAFGTSVFDTTAQHFALIFRSDLFQLIENNYVLQFDGDKANDLFHYSTDSLLKNDLFNKEPKISSGMENKVKAIIQTYQQSLINNKMH